MALYHAGQVVNDVAALLHEVFLLERVLADKIAGDIFIKLTRLRIQHLHIQLAVVPRSLFRSTYYAHQIRNRVDIAVVLPDSIEYIRAGRALLPAGELSKQHFLCLLEVRQRVKTRDNPAAIVFLESTTDFMMS